MSPLGPHAPIKMSCGIKMLLFLSLVQVTSCMFMSAIDFDPVLAHSSLPKPHLPYVVCCESSGRLLVTTLERETRAVGTNKKALKGSNL